MLKALERHQFLIVGLLIILLGSTIRLHNLGDDSLWFDEILTVNSARNGLNSALAVRDHPPILYLLTSLTINSFGENEYTLRISQALFGVISLALTMMLGRVIGYRRAGLWAAFLLALSPFHLRYSQEARHYALLMTFSLASFIVLVLALLKPKRGLWVLFGLITVLNLYTHSAALLVLAAEIVVIGHWSLSHLRHDKYFPVLQPIFAGVTILLLYSIWLPRLIVTIRGNLGENAAKGTTGVTSLENWSREAFLAFGFNTGVLPWLAVVLGLMGIGILISHRKWFVLLLFLAILLVPLFAIIGFNVARWSFPKYIIFALPVYLLAIGLAIDYLLSRFGYLLKKPKRVYLISSIVLAILFILVVRSSVLAEYEYVETDWKGAATLLRDIAADNDIFLVSQVDLPDGFNLGAIALPYYLDQTFEGYKILDATRLRQDDLQELTQSDANVWAVVVGPTNPKNTDETDMRIETYQGYVFVFHNKQSNLATLDQLKRYYEQIIPLALDPSPKCLLERDLAAIYYASSDYLTAQDVLESAANRCPDSRPSRRTRELSQAIDHKLLDYYMKVGNKGQVKNIAHRLLEINAKDEAAWEAITVEDLLQEYKQGQANVAEELAPEPVEVRRYEMTHNGDWGEVLFIHPPASVSYKIVLPPEPTALHFRAALAPESWNWGGDGSTFVVQIETEGETNEEIFRHHIGNTPDEQDWHEQLISLAPFAGQAITLTLATEAGPVGDTIGDWAGWETPRIIWP